MTIVLKNIDTLMTMNKQMEELTHAYILIENNVIKEIGSGEPPKADWQIDMSNKVVLPGFVNTHHHL